MNDLSAKLEQVIAILHVSSSSPRQIAVDQEYQKLLKLKGNAYSVRSLLPPSPIASVIPPAEAIGLGYGGYHFALLNELKERFKAKEV